MLTEVISYQRVCGIDVAKDTLEFLVMAEVTAGGESGNDAKGFARIIELCRKHQVQIVVMEATGGYERALAEAMVAAGMTLAVVNPKRVRHHALGEGMMAKTDKVDARIIAMFALKIAPKPTELRSALEAELSDLEARKAQLVKCKVAEENRLQQQANAMIQQGIRRHLRFIEKEIGKIETRLDELVKADVTMQCKAEAADGVTGVGRASAVALVAGMPELGKLTGKQAGALAGVAPFNKDSGKVIGERHIMGGRAPVRCVLYMCTLSAISYNEKIKAFYRRLLAAGKCKMKALTACMRKMLVIINARVREALASAAGINPTTGLG